MIILVIYGDIQDRMMLLGYPMGKITSADYAGSSVTGISIEKIMEIARLQQATDFSCRLIE
jgi:hypothetical protein